MGRLKNCSFAINKFVFDSEKEIEVLKQLLKEDGVDLSLVESWEKGGEGATDLAQKIVKLCDTVELDRSNLSPFIKGFLLDESKGEHEQINLSSDNLYNKEQIKILRTYFNSEINHNNSWYDYFKNYFFGNSLFNKKATKNQAIQEKKLNFIFNCTGKLIAGFY